MLSRHNAAIRRRANLWTAIVATGGLMGACLFTPTAQAGDCGCQACDACQTSPRGLDRLKLIGGKFHDSLVYKALDGVAGGIEKVLGLDKCNHGHASCDDGCDAAMMDELMVPMPPMESYSTPMPIQSHPSHGHHHSTVPPAPIRSQPMTSQPMGSGTGIPPHVQTAPQNTAPQTRMRMSQPRMSPTPSSEPMPFQPAERMSTPMPPTPAPISPEPMSPAPISPAPIVAPEPATRPDGPKLPAPPIPDDESDSLFDALSNPFGDDEVHVHRFQSVKPSNYEPELRPIRKRVISKDQSSSSRRASSRR